MTVGKAANDPAQRDQAWMGYHPRAMAPAVALTAVASLLVWTGRWYLDELSAFADEAGDWAMFALAWAVWPALLAVFFYRTVMFTYRLSDREMLVDYGPLYHPVPHVLLKEIASVVVGGGWLARLLGVGRVEIHLQGRTVRMKGVRHPQVFAEKIRTAVVVARAA
jgi:uncharacterized membrane protein YdbT with pleckstrin-like domain